MIYYLATRRNRFTIGDYLRHYQPAMERKVKILDYESLPARRSLAAGVYIFTDLERLTSSEHEVMSELADQLEAADRRARVFNHPRRVLLRYDLLRTLRQRGINDYGVYRLADRHMASLPAFVRHEHTHVGSLTPPIETTEALGAAVDRLVGAGADADRLMVVEFCDTSDRAGLYRKYGVFIVGDEVIPRHEVVGTAWMMKVASAINDEHFLAEERAYLETNPHREWIRSVCAIAGIEYGRIDYSIKDGRPQAWEINTNPQIALRPRRDDPRLANNVRFAGSLSSALEAMDDQELDGEPIPVTVRRPDPRPAGRRWIRGFAHRVKRRLRRHRER